MPNWCSNRLYISGSAENISTVRQLMEGSLYPVHLQAIKHSIKLFVAGCASVLKPLTEKKCLLCPDLVCQGLGETSEINLAFSEWLELLISDPLLDDNVCQKIIDLYRHTELAARSWNSMSSSEQAIIYALYRKKLFDWSGDFSKPITVEKWWQQLDEPPKAFPLDLRFLLPTQLAAEINGFNGGLLNTDSTYDVYLKKYGIKWPSGSSLNIDSYSEVPDGASLTVSFDTPWGPPDIDVITRLSAQYCCHLIHYYSEQGADFCGFTECSSGELIKSECDALEYGPTDEEGYREITGPSYILEHVEHFGS